MVLSLVTRTGWSQDVIISENIRVLVVNKIPTKQVAGLNRPVGELAVADSTGCIKCLVYDSKQLYNQLAVDKMYTISNFKRGRQDYLIFNDETVCQDVVPQYMIEAANKLLGSPKKSVHEVLAMTEEEAKGVAFTLCGIVKEIEAPDVRRNQFKDSPDFIDSIPSSWSLGSLLGEDGELMPVIKFTVKDNETADEILVYFWEGENSVVTTRDIQKGDSGDTVQMTNVKLKNWPGKTVTNTYKTEIRFQHKQTQNGSPLKRTAGEEVNCCSPGKVEKLH